MSTLKFHRQLEHKCRRDEGNWLMSWSQESFLHCHVLPTEQPCQDQQLTCLCHTGPLKIYCLSPYTLEWGRLQFFHQGFEPGCSVDQFCSGNDVLCASILHLGQKSQRSDLCIRDAPQEEHQGDSVLTMLTCGFTQSSRLAWFDFYSSPASTVSQTQMT